MTWNKIRIYFLFLWPNQANMVWEYDEYIRVPIFSKKLDQNFSYWYRQQEYEQTDHFCIPKGIIFYRFKCFPFSEAKNKVKTENSRQCIWKKKEFKSCKNSFFDHLHWKKSNQQKFQLVKWLCELWRLFQLALVIRYDDLSRAIIYLYTYLFWLLFLAEQTKHFFFSIKIYFTRKVYFRIQNCIKICVKVLIFFWWCFR